MQYTGLKDKNGKEIYEGDIVKGDTTRFTARQYIGDNPHRKEYVGVVEYHGASFVIFYKEQKIINRFGGSRFMHFINSEESNREITGNIYESPNLLDEGGK